MDLPLIGIYRSWIGDSPTNSHHHARTSTRIIISRRLKTDAIATEDGQLLLKSKKKKKKRCVCVKKEMNGAATAYWVEKDITRSSVFQNAEMLGRGFALSQKARQAPAY